VTEPRSWSLGAVAGLATLLIGAIALLSWLSPFEVVRGIGLAGVRVNPMTAITLALSGAGLLSLLAPGASPARERLGMACAWILIAIAIARLGAGPLGSFRVDRLILPSRISVGPGATMGPFSAIAAFCFGLTLTLLPRPGARARVARLISIAATLVVSFGAVIGYAYQSGSMHGPMALASALGFVCAAAGALLARPDEPYLSILWRPGPARALVYRLLPAVFVIPFALGWLRLAGQRAGWFDLAEGTSLLVVSVTLILAALTLWTARTLGTAESALRSSEERFRTLAATASDGIVSANEAGLITYLNAAAEAMFGIPSDRAAGRPLTILMPERFREAHERGFARYLGGGTPRVIGQTVELVGRHAEGREFPIELSLASWRQAGERAFTAVIRNITERKQAQEALEHNAAELKAANAELDAFSYSVSHDLRAPLRGIDGFSQALLEDCAERLDETGRGYLQRIRTATQRMGALIDDLLDLSRLTRSTMDREWVDLSSMARQIAAEIEQSDSARRVEWRIASDLGAEADPRLLRIALENLIGNSWKYSRHRVETVIEIGRCQHDGQSAFFIRDNGVGFDPTYAHKLFAPFQRLHSAAEFEGTGIGLATVARVVRRHGGKVWAEGAPDRGVTIYFTL
jgi:PAS domain S-box-containing protein